MSSQIKNQMRKAFTLKKIMQIRLRGGMYPYYLNLNTAKIVQTLNNSKQIKVIGSYIPLITKQIIPPFYSKFQYAYPFFTHNNKLNCQQQMKFKLHKISAKYTSKTYGIKIPSIQQQSVMPELFFVPLTCFNPFSKHRIGLGGGFYDRFIKNNRHQQNNIKFIGIGLQVLKNQESIFWTEADQPLDYVVTQKQMYVSETFQLHKIKCKVMIYKKMIQQYINKAKKQDSVKDIL